MKQMHYESPALDPYEKQVELNREFHRYCVNYSIVYKGPNIAQYQIGSTAINEGDI